MNENKFENKPPFSFRINKPNYCCWCLTASQETGNGSIFTTYWSNWPQTCWAMLCEGQWRQRRRPAPAESRPPRRRSRRCWGRTAARKRRRRSWRPSSRCPRSPGWPRNLGWPRMGSLRRSPRRRWRPLLEDRCLQVSMGPFPKYSHPGPNTNFKMFSGKTKTFRTNQIWKVRHVNESSPLYSDAAK